MKITWRNSGEKIGTLNHTRIFSAGEKHDGRNAREFMVYLIRQSTAAEVALNNKIIWKLGTSYIDADALVVRAMIGEPRQASALITVDYNVQGDWIDHECRACGGLFGTHNNCSALSGLDKAWAA